MPCLWHCRHNAALSNANHCQPTFCRRTHIALPASKTWGGIWGARGHSTPVPITHIASAMQRKRTTRTKGGLGCPVCPSRRQCSASFPPGTISATQRFSSEAAEFCRRSALGELSDLLSALSLQPRHEGHKPSNRLLERVRYNRTQTEGGAELCILSRFVPSEPPTKPTIAANALPSLFLGPIIG